MAEPDAGAGWVLEELVIRGETKQGKVRFTFPNGRELVKTLGWTRATTGAEIKIACAQVYRELLAQGAAADDDAADLVGVKQTPEA